MTRSLSRLVPAIGIALAGFVTFYATPAHALRCGDGLVVVGDPVARVRARCGEPASITSRVETRGAITTPVAPGGTRDVNATTVTIDVWVYDFGRSRFMEEVTFENGIVRRLRRLGYGSDRDAPAKTGRRPKVKGG